MTTPATAHILVVDDDPKIRLLLRRCLEGEGFRVSEAGTAQEARRRIAESPPDLATLDIGLPDEDGLALVREIRGQSRIPVVMLTGRGDTIDRVVGLELGADDYVTKPFHLREVLARIRAVLRRIDPSANGPEGRDANAARKDVFQFAGWRLDVPKRELLSPDGELCELTTAEFSLLEVLVRHANTVLSRDRIMDLMKGHDWSPTDRTIDNMVVKLRRKIEPAPGHRQLIKTVRGVGYSLTADVTRTT
jgi:DNA-binding response OmpR family regulator